MPSKTFGVWLVGVVVVWEVDFGWVLYSDGRTITVVVPPSYLLILNYSPGLTLQ